MKLPDKQAPRRCYDCGKVIPYFGLGSMCVDCIAKHSTEPLVG